MGEHESGLTHKELREFTQYVVSIICSEWVRGSSLESSRIRELLDDQGIEVPDYAMSDVLEGLKGLIRVPFRRHNEEARRKHGDFTIRGVDPLLCDG